MSCINNYSVTEISRATGISRATLYKLFNNAEFKKAIAERKAAIVRATVGAMQSRLLKNVDTLQGIADDLENAPQVRINAIQVLMSQLKDYMSITDISERLAEIETKLNENSTAQGGKV
jgi:AcrR family transcriptional regulator